MDGIVVPRNISNDSDDSSDSDSGQATSESADSMGLDELRASTPPVYFDLYEELTGKFREDPSLSGPPEDPSLSGPPTCNIEIDTKPHLPEMHPYWRMPQEIRDDIARMVIREKLARQAVEELIKYTEGKKITRSDGYEYGAKTYNEMVAKREMIFEIIDRKKLDPDAYSQLVSEGGEHEVKTETDK